MLQCVKNVKQMRSLDLTVVKVRLYAIILWAISGAIANIGNKKNNDYVINQVWNAAYEYNHPFMSMIIGILVNAVFGPILLIANFIGYARTKAQYNKDLQDLETIKAAVNYT